MQGGRILPHSDRQPKTRFNLFTAGSNGSPRKLADRKTADPPPCLAFRSVCDRVLLDIDHLRRQHQAYLFVFLLWIAQGQHPDHVSVRT